MFADALPEGVARSRHGRCCLGCESRDEQQR